MANSPSYEYTGIVHEVQEVQKFQSGFTKQNLILKPEDEDEASQWKTRLQFEFKKDKTALLANVRKGMKVTVKFNLDGREWDNPKSGKKQYFTSLTAWKIDVQGGAEASNVPPPAEPPSEGMGIDDVEDSDIPF